MSSASLKLAIAAIAMAAAALAAAQTRVVGAQPAASAATPEDPAASQPAAPGQGGARTRPGQPMNGRPAQPQSYPGAMPSPKIDLVNEAIDEIAPLTPEQVRQVRRILDAREGALDENLSGKAPPRPSSQIYQLDLSPSSDSAPPVVRATPGQGVVVSFLDATGKPWPIEVADNANASGLTVNKFTDHQLSIFVNNPRVIGNVLVALRGLPPSIGFSVVAGQERTDYQVQMVVPRFKDGVPTNVISSGSIPAVGTADLFNFLLRTPPAGARELKVLGLPGAYAWQTSPSKMVIRTEATLTSAIRHFSLDGVGVYEVPLSPLVIGTLNGRYVEMNVSGFNGAPK